MKKIITSKALQINYKITGFTAFIFISLKTFLNSEIPEPKLTRFNIRLSG
jgi:hypothetical protein